MMTKCSFNYNYSFKLNCFSNIKQSYGSIRLKILCFYGALYSGPHPLYRKKQCEHSSNLLFLCSMKGIQVWGNTSESKLIEISFLGNISL